MIVDSEAELLTPQKPADPKMESLNFKEAADPEKEPSRGRHYYVSLGVVVVMLAVLVMVMTVLACTFAPLLQ